MSRSGCALSLVRQRQLKIGGGGFVKKISVMASATMMTLGCMTQAVAQQEAVPAADGQQQAAPNSRAPPPAQPADQAHYRSEERRTGKTWDGMWRYRGSTSH